MDTVIKALDESLSKANRWVRTIQHATNKANNAIKADTNATERKK